MKNNLTKIILSLILLAFISFGLICAINLVEYRSEDYLGRSVFASTCAVIVMILLRDILFEEKSKKN